MKFLLSILSISFITFSFGQVITVKDVRTNLPVNDGILELKTLNGDERIYIDHTENGRFIIENVDPKQQFLIISFYSDQYYAFTDTLNRLIDTVYYAKRDERIKNLDEFVVTAQYEKLKVEDAVHSIQVISEEKIQNMGAQNLRDVLTNQMNVRLGQDFALGSSMSLSGVSGQNVKILIDGIPVTGRLNGNIDISQINLNNVERIEIVEGPLSVSYGTDALAGTINIITKKGNKKEATAQLNNHYESAGIYSTTGRIGLGNKKNQFSFDFGRYYFDGWNAQDRAFYYNFDPIADQSRFQLWKPKEQFHGTLNYRRTFKNQKIDFTSNYFNEEVINRGAPRAPYYINAFDDYYKTLRVDNSITSSGKIGKKFNYTAFIAYNHFKRTKNTFFRDLTTIQDQLTENDGDQDTSVFTNIMSRGSLFNSKTNKKFNYEIGYDLNIETGIGPRILNQKQLIGDYAIYSTAEIRPTDKLILRPGLRVIHNTAYQAPLIPSLNIKYDLIKNEAKKQFFTLRTSYARGFRAPDLKELYFFFVDINHNIQGNPTLQAESSNNFTLALDYKFNIKENPISLKLQGFYNSIENMISLAQENESLFTFYNINRFRTTGLQLSNSMKIKELTITTGFSYIGRYNELIELNNELTPQFLFSPEGQLNVQYKFEKLNGSINLFYKYTGRLPIVRVNEDDAVDIVTIDAFSTLDLSVSKYFTNNRIVLTTGVKNMLNVTNVNGFNAGGAHSGGSNSMQIGMGRTYFLTLNIQLSKPIKK